MRIILLLFIKLLPYRKPISIYNNSIKSILMDYNLELKRVTREIKKSKARTICIQLPDGLKPKADDISSFIEKNTNAKVIIWAGSCFGSCDVPDIKGVDLLVQWGHSKWKK
jgi:2-(3-amino-3-carboxypropyl)histidine synthase